MKITVCGSMTFSKKMLDIERELLGLKHEVVLPRFAKEYSKLETADEIHAESAENKIKHDLIKDHYYEIKNSDAILVVNKDKKDIKNYIGGNSLIEIAFAHILEKKIFLLNPIPQMNYIDEIIAMKPVVLNGNLTKIL